jgi:putative transcriptional regulator
MIKNRLRHILLDRKMSMRQLAFDMDLHYTTVYRFANMETSSVNYELLDSICAFLDLQPGDLLQRVDGLDGSEGEPEGSEGEGEG